MNKVTQLLAAVVMVAGASLAVAAPAHADSMQISLNLGEGRFYHPAPVRQVVVKQPVVYRPAPRIVYVEPRWRHGHRWGHDRWERGHPRGHIAYGYGRGW